MTLGEFIIIMCVIWILAIFAIIIISHFAIYGSALEDPLEPTLKEKLLQRAQEWNIQTAINETLALAERFEK